MSLSIMSQAKPQHKESPSTIFASIILGFSVATLLHIGGGLRGKFAEVGAVVGLVGSTSALYTYTFTRHRAAQREQELERKVASLLEESIDTERELAEARDLVSSLEDRDYLWCHRLEQVAAESSNQIQFLQRQLEELHSEEILPPPPGWPLAH
jgi:hypothetical protein